MKLKPDWAHAIWKAAVTIGVTAVFGMTTVHFSKSHVPKWHVTVAYGAAAGSGGEASYGSPEQNASYSGAYSQNSSQRGGQGGNEGGYSGGSQTSTTSQGGGYSTGGSSSGGSGSGYNGGVGYNGGTNTGSSSSYYGGINTNTVYTVSGIPASMSHNTEMGGSADRAAALTATYAGVYAASLAAPNTGNPINTFVRNQAFELSYYKALDQRYTALDVPLSQRALPAGPLEAAIIKKPKLIDSHKAFDIDADYISGIVNSVYVPGEIDATTAQYRFGLNPLQRLGAMRNIIVIGPAGQLMQEGILPKDGYGAASGGFVTAIPANVPNFNGVLQHEMTWAGMGAIQDYFNANVVVDSSNTIVANGLAAWLTIAGNGWDGTPVGYVYDTTVLSGQTQAAMFTTIGHSNVLGYAAYVYNQLNQQSVNPTYTKLGLQTNFAGDLYNTLVSQGMSPSAAVAEAQSVGDQLQRSSTNQFLNSSLNNFASAMLSGGLK